ncbi:MAG: SAM-dependent methyltransferase [Candidatus Poribacteria bacterium]|nr:SAM-dependent methyltransferase [Candidatus Poribacteria bacterium]MDE0506341.1 SAM-dependent methyltransferase [Candidatus Poribacteria bacterium]
MRLLSIGQWHHFAHMIISLALLGFGASGSVIAISQRWLMRRFHAAYTASAILYTITLVGCFALNQLIPFNPFMVVWDPIQLLFLVSRYLILAVPFFFGAACIGMALLRFNRDVSRLYFFDLLGSGMGALGIILVMYHVPPVQILTVVSTIGLCGVMIAHVSRRWKSVSIITVIVVGLIGYLAVKPIEIKISPYKGLSSTLNFPDTEILSNRYSPLGILHVARSNSIRTVPGLSIRSVHSIPPQLGLFTDADAMTAITHFKGDPSELDFLDDTISAAAYHLVDKPRVLILGAGGGSDVLNAMYHNAASVVAVEMNPQIVDLMADQYRDFSGNIFGSVSSFPVNVHVAEARGFIRSTREKYDLIQIALLDSLGASASGTHSLNENYLYTVEAIEEFIQHLTPGGILSITRWLKSPPRDMIKLLATAVEALERIDGAVPANQLALIREWRTGTLLIKKGPFTSFEKEALRNFCNRRSFDLAYYPQMAVLEANRYNQLPEPTYFAAAQEIIHGDRDEFYRDYPFQIRPATDNCPYFSQFLRLDSLARMIHTIGRNAIPFIEWGYLILIAMLIQAGVFGLVLVLLPLRFLRRQPTPLTACSDCSALFNQEFSASTRKQGAVKWRVCAYFLSLGIGFMLIEMTYIQKFLLLLSYPTYAVAVVLCGFLVFAGLGSFCCPRTARIIQNFGFRNTIPVVIIILSLIAFVYLWLLSPIFGRFIASSDPLKIVVSIGLIAPLAFFMGMPFPLGIERLRAIRPDLIAWAWGINGFASVVGAILATCLAITFGFNAVILMAIVVYAAGAWLVPS